MTSSSLNILVLSGGISHERDISLRSGRCVADALVRSGHRVTVREPDPTLVDHIIDNTPDVVWPALHGASGEDGGLQALLEATGVPFVGSTSNACHLTWSKPVTKALMAAQKIATPPSVTLTKETFRELGATGVLNVIVRELGMPLVVKPAQGGSAQGVNVVTRAADLPRAMIEAYTYADIALVEQHVSGTEVSISIIDRGEGPEVLPAVEIEPIGGIYTFEARYNAGKTFFYTPPRLPGGVIDELEQSALNAYRFLGLRHLARIDFIIDNDVEPWFLEANTLPGLTETSLLPQAIHAAGFTPGEIYSHMARNAIEN